MHLFHKYGENFETHNTKLILFNQIMSNKDFFDSKFLASDYFSFLKRDEELIDQGKFQWDKSVITHFSGRFQFIMPFVMAPHNNIKLFLYNFKTD